jgi:hypothetical protein
VKQLIIIVGRKDQEDEMGTKQIDPAALAGTALAGVLAVSIQPGPWEAFSSIVTSIRDNAFKARQDIEP